MKTRSIQRVLVAAVVMTAIACTDPLEKEDPRPATTTKNDFHTSVTTWSTSENNDFVGLVSLVPNTDLTKAKIFVLRDNIKVQIYDYPYQEIFDGYIWTTLKNNIILLNYRGLGANPKPPSPLDLNIVY